MNKTLLFKTIFTLCLISTFFNKPLLINAQNINKVQNNNHLFINGFFVSAIYDTNNVHLVWDEYIKPNIKISEVFIEKTNDGLNWELLASKPTFNLFDIHVNNYPTNIDYNGVILYSTEVGKGRFIYNDLCEYGELDNTLIRYRAGFKTVDGKYFYTSEIDANSQLSQPGLRFAEKDEMEITYEEIEGKITKKPPIITSKVVCPSVGSPPSGSTNTGQTQVFYGTCCTWTETLYHLPSTFQIVCNTSSYAWCCNNVTGEAGCTSGYWWDWCCVHTCAQFNSCSCHPWSCCNMIPGQDVWVVTSSTPFSGFQVNTQITQETCPNSSDGSVVLTPSGGTAPFTYAWAGGQTSSSLYFLTAGNYSCTVTDANGCTTPVSVAITSNPSPPANAGVDQTICSGDIATLTASGGVGYLWSTSSTNQTITVNPAYNQTYTVTVASSFGCTASDNVVINVYDITSPFTVTSPICLENTSTITYTGNATSSATYNWYFGGGTLVSGSGAGPLEVQWSNGGTYNITLTVDEPNCNTSTQTTMNVNVIDVTASKIENNPLCYGSSDGNVGVIPANGFAPYMYLWSNNGETTSNISGLTQGLYTVTITDNIGCIEIVDLAINNPPLLQANIVNQSNVSCFGGNDGAIIATAIGGTAPYSYNWNPTAVNSNAISGLSIGTYYVTITDANFCTDSTMTIITEPDILIAVISDSIDILCNGAATGSTTVSVIGGTLPYSYTWNTNPPQHLATANNLIAGNYSVTVTDVNSCTTNASVTLEEPTAILTTIIPQNETCKDFCNGEAMVTASGGTPTYTYSWSTNPTQNNSNAANLCTGIWIVTVTDNNGCIKTDSALIITNSPITAIASATSTSGFVPININFFFSGSGAATYNWDFGDGNTSTDQNPAHVFTTAGIYNVILTANSGAPDFCTDSYTITLIFENPSSVFIPNIFTPNGDGHNDIFKIDAVSMAEESMLIFNRWGKKVYEWSNLGGSWDGENNSDGTYYYIFQGRGRDKIEYNLNGTITLMRGKP